MEMSGSASEIHVHLYIVVQCGLSSICEDSTNIVYNLAQKGGPVPPWIHLCISFDSERDLEGFF
jgi:hypothetical protein